MGRACLLPFCEYSTVKIATNVKNSNKNGNTETVSVLGLRNTVSKRYLRCKPGNDNDRRWYGTGSNP